MMALGKRLSVTETWSMQMGLEKVAELLHATLLDHGWKIVRLDHSTIYARHGHLLTSFYGKPDKWPIRMSVNFDSQDDTSRICMVVTDDMPFGTPIGTERTYMNVISRAASTVRSDVEGRTQ